MSNETDVFLHTLNAHREHVLGIVADLDDDQMRRSVVASAWTFVGMVLHLAASEHYWLHCKFAGLTADFHGIHTTDLDLWNVGPDESVESILALYRRQMDESNELVRASSLDTPLAARDDAWGTWVVPDLRAVLFQVIGHTATHAGHLDVARETLDGRQWQVL